MSRAAVPKLTVVTEPFFTVVSSSWLLWVLPILDHMRFCMIQDGVSGRGGKKRPLGTSWRAPLCLQQHLRTPEFTQFGNQWSRAVASNIFSLLTLLLYWATGCSSLVGLQSYTLYRVAGSSWEFCWLVSIVPWEVTTQSLGTTGLEDGDCWYFPFHNAWRYITSYMYWVPHKLNHPFFRKLLLRSAAVCMAATHFKKFCK